MKKLKSKNAQGLLAALYFVSAAQKNEADTPYKTHCIIHNNTITAYDNVITIGCKIEEQIEACPHTFRFIDALERTSKDLSITELEGKLSVKSGSFSALVPCFSEGMPRLEPDNPSCVISDSLRTGFEMISGFTVDSDKKRIVETSILLKANSMIASDGIVMLEYWHGFDLPTCVVPKSFVSAIINCKKKIVSFGYSESSCTFWFDDNSWIKTQLYEESWPDTDKILNRESKAEKLPEGFYEALRTIEPFSEGKEAEKVAYFFDGKLQSHRDNSLGATYDLVGIKHGPAFNIKRLKRIEHCIETVDFYSHDVMYFFGKGVRGALAGVRR